jgi:hypothetical protein
MNKCGCSCVTIGNKADWHDLEIKGLLEVEAFMHIVQDRMLGQNNNNDRSSTTATIDEDEQGMLSDGIEERVFALNYGRVRWGRFLKFCVLYAKVLLFILLVPLLMVIADVNGSAANHMIGPMIGPVGSFFVFLFWQQRTFVARVATTSTGIRYDRLDHPVATAFTSQKRLYQNNNNDGRSVHTTTLQVCFFVAPVVSFFFFSPSHTVLVVFLLHMRRRRCHKK